jgi:hypothetical protein
VRDLDLDSSAARIAKAGGGEVPTSPTLATEAARGAKLRINERYSATSMIPRDRLGDDLVDLWVARAGFAFALEATIAATRIDKGGVGPDERYELRRDAKPWPRLREHAVANHIDVEPLVAKAWGNGTWKLGMSELPFALAFLTCKRDWIDRVVAQAVDGYLDYGQQCVLAAATDLKHASSLLRSCARNPQRFQLDEEGFEFVPTAMRVLPDSDAEVLVAVAETCASKKTRAPWLGIIGSLTTAKAKAFIAKHGLSPATKPTKPAKGRSRSKLK